MHNYMNKQLDTLMQKEMTRKEFLATMGLAVASIMGFSSVLRLLGGKSHGSSAGYGSRSYGR
jgi:hypothetical protein